MQYTAKRLCKLLSEIPAIPSASQPSHPQSSYPKSCIQQSPPAINLKALPAFSENQ